MKKYFPVICLFIFGFTFLCNASPLIEITDMAGRSVKTPLDPERIICLGPGSLRLIVYLNAQSKVVGVEDMEKMNPDGRPYWIASPELHELPSCGPGGPAGTGKKPDLEKVLSLKPDVIFTTYMEDTMADDIQNTLNIPVILLSYGEYATFDEAVYKSLVTAGKILNRENRAKAVVEYIESLRKDFNSRTAHIDKNKRPLVYVGGVGYRGSHGIESSEQSYIPFKWINADNAAERVKASTGSHVFMNKEMLLSLDPDVIFIDGGGISLVKDDFNKKPEYYRVLKAFREKQVYSLFPFNWYATNIGTALADACVIGKVLYPDEFKDMNPEYRANEIYRFLTGAPVYSQMAEYYGVPGEKLQF